MLDTKIIAQKLRYTVPTRNERIAKMERNAPMTDYLYVGTSYRLQGDPMGPGSLDSLKSVMVREYIRLGCPSGL